MTGTRWFPVLDYGAPEYRVRLRDALWGGIATLRTSDGSLADPLIFRSREDAFRWIRECGEAWDQDPENAPDREAALCASCMEKTGRPVTFDSGFSASGPGTTTRSYCIPCATVRLSPAQLGMLRTAHEAVCTKCRASRYCHERAILSETYDDAARISSARDLDH